MDLAREGEVGGGEGRRREAQIHADARPAAGGRDEVR